jgi:protein O-mannosyl-transferase
MSGQIFPKLNNSFNKWYILIIITLTTLTYLPTFHGSFIIDDIALIKNNLYIRENHSAFSYLSQEDGIADEIDKGVLHTGYYRPLTNLTYHFDYLLWGMDARGFRTTNIILHLLVALFLYVVISYLFLNKTAAFFSTLIFALHPVNTETISSIVNRNNILAVLFFLASFYCYLQSREKGKHGLFTLSVFLFGLSVFSKEIGIMGIGIFFLYNRVISSGEKKILKELLSYLPYFLLIIMYLILRFYALGPSFISLDLNNILMRFYYAPWLFCYNLFIIFFPWRLHSYIVSYPTDMTSIAAIASITLFIATAIVIILIRKKYKIVAFSVGAFFLAVFPILNIIPKTSVSLISVRWLYFPLIFIAMLIAWIIKSVKKEKQEMLFAVLITIMCYLGIYSFMLNRYLWYNEKTFITQEVKNFRNGPYMGLYAELLYEEKKFDEVEKYFLIALNSSPVMSDTYNGYALVLINKGRIDEAYSMLEKAEKMAKTSSQRQEWLHLMGIAKIRQGKNKEALDYLFKAISIKQNPEIFNSICVVYMVLKEKEKALSYVKKGLELAPENEALISNFRKLSQ